MNAALRLLAFCLFVLMLAIDTTYGHTIPGKIASLALFIAALGLAFASLGDEDKPRNTP